MTDAVKNETLNEKETADDMITIYIMGRAYEVPNNLTIMKAMEYAGYRFIRGCGCRGGVLRGLRNSLQNER